MRNLVKLFLVFGLIISAASVLGAPILNITDQQQNQEPNAEQQTPQASQGQPSSSAVVQSVSGCVVQSDQGYSLKTTSDTYPIETQKDISKYLNKQIRVTGILEHHTTPTPSAAAGNTATVTDIRLRTIVSVIGDCNQPSK
jgi:hypothetical protein